MPRLAPGQRVISIDGTVHMAVSKSSMHQMPRVSIADDKGVTTIEALIYNAVCPSGGSAEGTVRFRILIEPVDELITELTTSPLPNGCAL